MRLGAEISIHWHSHLILWTGSADEPWIAVQITLANSTCSCYQVFCEQSDLFRQFLGHFLLFITIISCAVALLTFIFAVSVCDFGFTRIRRFHARLRFAFHYHWLSLQPISLNSFVIFFGGGRLVRLIKLCWWELRSSGSLRSMFNSPEERSSHLFRGESLKSRIALLMFVNILVFYLILFVTNWYISRAHQTTA